MKVSVRRLHERSRGKYLAPPTEGLQNEIVHQVMTQFSRQFNRLKRYFAMQALHIFFSCQQSEKPKDRFPPSYSGGIDLFAATSIRKSDKEESFANDSGQ